MSLAAVVEELKIQNNTLTDVKNSIAAILQGDVDRQKAEARAAGDRREAAEEAKRQRNKARRTVTATKPAKTLAGGFSQGIGLDGLIQSVKDGVGLIFPAAAGATLAGFVGKALGRVFMIGAAAVFGQYLADDYISEKLGDYDVKVGEAFGKEWDVSDIASSVGGVLALMFGPALVKGAIRSSLGLAATATGAAVTAAAAKNPKITKAFKDSFSPKGRIVRGVRYLGWAGLIATTGMVLSDIIVDQFPEGSDAKAQAEVGKSLFDYALMGTTLGAMFGPKGMIIGATAGFAAGLAMLLVKGINERSALRAAEIERKYQEQVTKKMDELEAQLEGKSSTEQEKIIEKKLEDTATIAASDIDGTGPTSDVADYEATVNVAKDKGLLTPNMAATVDNYYAQMNEVFYKKMVLDRMRLAYGKANDPNVDNHLSVRGVKTDFIMALSKLKEDREKYIKHLPSLENLLPMPNFEEMGNLMYHPPGGPSMEERINRGMTSGKVENITIDGDGIPNVIVVPVEQGGGANNSGTTIGGAISQRDGSVVDTVDDADQIEQKNIQNNGQDAGYGLN